MGRFNAIIRSNFLKRLMSHLEEQSPVALDQLFRASPKGYGRSKNIDKIIEAINTDRLGETKFASRDSISNTLRRHPDMMSSNYFEPNTGEVRFTAPSLANDPSIIAHELRHRDVANQFGFVPISEYADPYVAGSSIAAPRYQFKKAGERYDVGEKSDWHRVYSDSEPNNPVDAHEVDALLNQFATTRKAGLVRNTSDSLDRWMWRVLPKYVKDYYKTTVGLAATAGVGMSRTGEES